MRRPKPNGKHYQLKLKPEPVSSDETGTEAVKRVLNQSLLLSPMASEKSKRLDDFGVSCAL